MFLAIAIGAVFLAGAACGAFATLVAGIHAEERRAMRERPSRSTAAARRLLSHSTGTVPATRVKAGR